MINAADLLQLNAALPATRAALFADALEQARARGDLTTSRRIRHFIGQIAEETGCFRSLIESTAYKDPARLDRLFANVQGPEHARRLIDQGPVAIGNTIYAHKLGNGDVASGDGYRYRGRGFLQITGRANYRRIGDIVDMPLESEPELLGEPGPAADAAAAFWKARNINAAADADDVSTVTQLVNGPMRVGLAGRAAWVAKAKAIWP